jgi:taurine dioxygenase
MSYIAEPPMASALYSLEVPPAGGDTGFCNMYQALETCRRICAGPSRAKPAIHDASRNSAGELRRGYVDAPDATQTVGAEHPIVRTHPATGRKALFLGRRRNAYIPACRLPTARRCSTRCGRMRRKDEFTWYQQWRAAI